MLIETIEVTVRMFLHCWNMLKVFFGSLGTANHFTKIKLTVDVGAPSITIRCLIIFAVLECSFNCSIP